MKKTIFLISLLLGIFTILLCNFIANSNSNPEKLNIKKKTFHAEPYYKIMGNIKDNEITNSIVVIPEKYEKKKHPLGVGYEAFKGAKKLREVTLTSNTKYIFSSAFENSNLTKINIPQDSSISYIGSEAFKNTNLTSIFIPKSVESIENNVFRKKTGKMTIYIEAEKIPDGWHEDWNIYNNDVILGISYSKYQEIINSDK